MTRYLNQSGIALVEFALVLPVLVLIAFGCAEFGRILQETQTAVFFSREVARTAYRLCGAERGASAQVCLNEVLSEHQAALNQIHPAAEVVVSSFQRVESTPSINSNTSPQNPAHSSRYNASNIRNLVLYRSSAPLLFAAPGQIVIVGEAFIPHNSIVPFISNVFFPGGLLYDAAIF